MKNLKIFPYPKIEKKHLDRMKYDSKLVLKYQKQKLDPLREFDIDLNQNILILAQDNDWDVACHTAFDYSITFDDLSFLWNDSNLKIVRDHQRLGLVLEYQSRESFHRGLSNHILFDRKHVFKNHKFDFHLKFQPNQLRGQITLNLLLFVGDETQSSEDNHRILAKKQGIVLGCFTSHQILIDGVGSLFPILEIMDKKEHYLWKMHFDFVDPLTDSFTVDNCCLYINQAHPNYPLLKGNDPLNSFEMTPLLKEILISWLSSLLSHVALEHKEIFNALTRDQNQIKSDVENSIFNYLVYFVDAFKIDIKSIPQIFKSTNQSINGI